jgi:hypothetical protein
MIRSTNKYVWIAAISLIFAAVANGQAPRDGRDRGRWDGRDRGRPTMDRPEDREQFYNRMIDQYMERLTRTYELNDQQQTEVRSHLEQLREQQRASAEQRRPEFESIREEFRTMRESGQFDRDRARELGERMRSAMQQSPLMNRDQVVAEVEKLLPPEQVQRGRAQRESEASEWRQRREEMRRTWEDRRQQARAQQDSTPQAQPDQQAPQDGDADTGRRAWGDRRERGERGDRGDRGIRGERGARGEQEASGDQRPQPQTRLRPPVDDPTGSWERYVRDFIRWYDLDASQQATAQSVLRTMLENRRNHERANRADRDAARNIADRSTREERLTQLNEPVVRMFGELKSQLERIPNAAQLEAARRAAPAPPTTEPAGQERPANRERRERDRGERQNRDRDTRGA